MTGEPENVKINGSEPNPLESSLHFLGYQVHRICQDQIEKGKAITRRRLLVEVHKRLEDLFAKPQEDIKQSIKLDVERFRQMFQPTDIYYQMWNPEASEIWFCEDCVEAGLGLFDTSAAFSTPCKKDDGTTTDSERTAAGPRNENV